MGNSGLREARIVAPMTVPADVLTRFSDRASDYAKRRPSYPAEAIDAALEGLGDPGRLIAADIGAGTGISSRLLAERGVRVLAIEPNGPMRAQGEAERHPLVEWRDATGESTGLAAHSIDLIVCAQAFHWLDAPRALAEFRRILKPGGRAAVIWNVLDERDALSQGYAKTVAAHATDPPQSPWFTGVSSPFPGASGWGAPRTSIAPNSQTLDGEGFVRRALSASYSPTSGPAHDALVGDLTDLFQTHAKNGVVCLRYVTETHLCETCAASTA